MRHVGHRKLLINFFLLGFLSYALHLASMYVCFHALGLPVNFPTLVVFTVTVLILRSFNIIPGNLGLTELVCGFLSQWMGGSFGDWAMVSGVSRVILYITIGLLSGFLSLKIFNRNL